jgi:hypothetical protein
VIQVPNWAPVLVAVVLVLLAAYDVYRIWRKPPETVRQLREGRSILVIVLGLAGFFTGLDLLAGSGWHAYLLDGLLAAFAIVGIIYRTRLMRQLAAEERETALGV